MKPKQRYNWLRRAGSIKRQAEALMCDMMQDVGPEHEVGGVNLTDYADNLCVASEDLARLLDVYGSQNP